MCAYELQVLSGHLGSHSTVTVMSRRIPAAKESKNDLHKTVNQHSSINVFVKYRTSIPVFYFDTRSIANLIKMMKVLFLPPVANLKSYEVHPVHVYHLLNID